MNGILYLINRFTVFQTQHFIQCKTWGKHVASDLTDMSTILIFTSMIYKLIVPFSTVKIVPEFPDFRSFNILTENSNRLNINVRYGNKTSEYK